MADLMFQCFLGAVFGVLASGAYRDERPADIAWVVAVGMSFGIMTGIILGCALDPNDYPRDRPAPTLAVYATCPVGSP